MPPLMVGYNIILRGGTFTQRWCPSLSYKPDEFLRVAAVIHLIVAGPTHDVRLVKFFLCSQQHVFLLSSASSKIGVRQAVPLELTTTTLITTSGIPTSTWLQLTALWRKAPQDTCRQAGYSWLDSWAIHNTLHSALRWATSYWFQSFFFNQTHSLSFNTLF